MISIRFALSYYEYCEKRLSSYDDCLGYISLCSYKTKKNDCVIS